MKDMSKEFAALSDEEFDKLKQDKEKLTENDRDKLFDEEHRRKFKKHKESLAQSLLEKKVDVNWQDPKHDNQTLLMEKMGKGAVHASIDDVKALIEIKADVNLKDSHGRTALSSTIPEKDYGYGTFADCVPVINLLINANAEVNVRLDRSPQQTLLMKALMVGYVRYRLVDELLAHKADATLADAQGMTALHYACAMTPVSAPEKSKVVQSLLDAKASPSAKNLKDEIPADLLGKGEDTVRSLLFKSPGSDSASASGSSSSSSSSSVSASTCSR